MKIWELIKTVFCKHKDTAKSSCPFTEKTYEVCTECGFTVSVIRTHA